MKLKLLLISILIIESELIELNCPSDLESNIDFYGNDIDKEYANSVDKCCSICHSYQYCTSFTFIELSQSCYLKNFTTNFHNRVSSFGSTYIE